MGLLQMPLMLLRGLYLDFLYHDSLLAELELGLELELELLAVLGVIS